MKLTADTLISNRYRLIRQIGLGGFSVVWLVSDQLMGDHEFALKVYAPDRGLDDAGLRQFQQEYLLTVRLNHPNLLKPSHYDIHEGSPYLVMPYCEDGSLFRMLSKKGRLEEEEIASLLFQLGGGLSYLHEEGLVHQDIKPDNVLIGGEGKFLLTDFGISSKMRSTLRKSTNTAKAMTVAYAPPERFKGTQTSGAAGDIFSVGVMIFELTTGDVPWMGAGGVVLRPDMELPELPGGYSKRLEQLMRWCMAYDPKDRPSAEELTALAAHYKKTGSWPEIPKRRNQKTDQGERVNPGRQTEYLKTEEPTLEKEEKPTKEEIPSHAVGKEKPKSKLWLAIAALALVLSAAGMYWWTGLGGHLPAAIVQLDKSMVRVDGGAFTMGCTSEQGSDCYWHEKPAHQVTLSTFRIGKYEVTQAQWRAVMGNNPSEFSGCDTCPVEMVSWNDIQEFLKKLNQLTGKDYRLPTEAEWEYAARGGNQSQGYKYSGGNTLGSVAWYDDNSGAKTQPVGEKSPNELGIYDMTGNVWEWCSDWYGEDYYASSLSSNPRGPSSGFYRVLRGGSWISSAVYCRVSNRGNFVPSDRFAYFGFRVVLSQ